MKRILYLTSAAAIAALGLGTVPASAADARAAAERKISYTDLDLTKRHDERRLRWRLDTAASELCTTDHMGRYSYRSSLGLRACKIKILGDVEPRVATILKNVRMAAAAGKAASKPALASLSVSR